VVVPKGETHTYKYIVDGAAVLDPINPQQLMRDNGQIWSRFFTDLCTQPVSLDRRELALLERITNRILPFRTAEGQNFLRRFVEQASAGDRVTQYARAYRLDQPVGAVNYIDNILAREENHHLIDYRICLRLIDRVLRLRNPVTEPAELPDDTFDELYQQMASNNVPGWDRGAYAEPAYFLRLLRRHTYTGAFSHPKYGGNTGASGWCYLEGRFTDPATGQTLFNWRRIMEKPLGDSPDYHG